MKEATSPNLIRVVLINTSTLICSLCPTLPWILYTSQACMDPEEQPLLPQLLAVRGAVDHLGLPARRKTTGGWKSAFFIIAMDVAGKFAFFGVSTNLITYLTGMLGQSTAFAAANVNAWSGAVSLLPLLGGLLADSWLGRYKTIIGSNLLCLLGLGLVTLSAVSPALHPSCNLDSQCSATDFQNAFFFSSLYLVALAQGGQRACTQAFGADQFDQEDPKEWELKSSFFNWWNFWSSGGILLAILTLSYIQDNISWALGFGIPCILQTLALLVFLVGRKTYRYPEYRRRVLGGWMGSKSEGEYCLSQEEKVTCSRSAGACCSSSAKGSTKDGCSFKEKHITDLSKLLPIWATCLVYAVVYAQRGTFFTKQGSTMAARIGPSLLVPPAALQSLISVSMMVTIPLYNHILVPITRAFTGLPSGITKLQRIGIGMVLSMLSMVIAALVEMKRLQVSKESGSVESIVPMSLWWLVPQYVLSGVADVFTLVGLQEFFYDQVPNAMRSLGIALYFSIFGIGSFISGLLVTLIDNVSSGSGESWVADDLNHGHLDCFYMLLAGLSAIQFLVFLYFSRAYVCREKAGLNGKSEKVLA